MKITKYPQSCLLVESNNSRILIDPGKFVAQKYTADLFGPIDAILVTHEHLDHANAQLISALKGDATKVYANRSTQLLLGNVVTDIVNDGQAFEVGTFHITARELPHVDLADGTAGPQNTGYLIDDVLFHPGDGVHIDGVKARVGALPIAGPDISPRDTFDLAKSIECEVVIPIHYDYFTENPEILNGEALKRTQPFRILTLAEGQSYDTDDFVA